MGEEGSWCGGESRGDGTIDCGERCSSGSARDRVSSCGAFSKLWEEVIGRDGGRRFKYRFISW